MTTTHSNDQQAPIPAYVWRLSAVVVLGTVMSILDTTIVNVALETLSRDFHSTITSVQWVVTAYVLALAAVIPVSGWAARRFGAKNVYVLSLILFTLGSALCGLATSTTELILFRVLQGLGGGMIMPLGQMMMAAGAGPKNIGRVMSITSVPMMVAPILGPTIGGLILENMPWRWIFFVNVPIGIVSVIAAVRMMPATKGERTDLLDYVGLALLSVGLPLVTYGLAEIGSTGTVYSAKVIIPILAGLALTVCFVFHALRVKRPLLQLRLYARGTFASASATLFCVSAALFAALVILPLYWQTVRHESVLQTGLLTSPQGLGSIMVMPFVGRLADRFGGGRFALFGVCLSTVFTIPLALVHDNTPIPFLCIVMLIRGMGVGLSFMPAMTAAFASLKKSELSDATPQMNALMRVGGALGTAILTVVLQQHLVHAKMLPAAQRLSASASAFGAAFWFSVALSAIAIVPCALLVITERRARSSGDGAEREHEALDAGVVAEAMSL